MSKTVLLIDAYSQIYRAFYAIRHLTGPDGAPVNAIFGWTKMLNKLLADHQPHLCAAVFDLGPPGERLALLPSYKAQRPPTPPDLDAQLPGIREILAALRIPAVECDGVEADDLIASLAWQVTQRGDEVLIVSQDKDFMQLVGPRIRLLRTTGKVTALMDAAGVEAHFGVSPDQIVDLLSLVGDSVDNIPGVPGVGEVTAAALLRQFHSIDNLLVHIDQIAKPKLREAIVAHAARLQLNRSLVALRTTLELPITLTQLETQAPDVAKLRDLYRRFGFKSFLAELDPPPPTTGDLFGSPDTH